MTRAENRKYHYIYKITCNVTNRFYIGMHSTDNLNDGYFGSGKRLWFSINYHGKNNHTKEILEFLETRELLKERERFLVNKELIQEKLCMNLVIGGEGGSFVNEEHFKKFQLAGSKAGNKAFKEKLANDEIFKEKFKLTKLLDSRNAILSGKLKPVNEVYDWNGKSHSEETKKLMSENSKGQGAGEANSQFGTCWVTKDGLNKRIKISEEQSHQQDGWVRGRYSKIKGESIKNSKISVEQVKEIKMLLNENMSATNISKQLNISRKIITDIKLNKTWVHIKI